ncbi:MAG: DUF58 domain-containing protein [Bacteroidales bacterium]|nr:DUF58 domain-containing protein [Bacteroidales bacterium]
MEAKELLKKVRKIEIKTKMLSSQIFAGEYHSAFKGKGMTFSEVREYQYGDDIRNIDWNVTARFNHPYVKVFEEERELIVMLLLDMSGSTDFGTQKQLKKELIAELAAVLSFSASLNNDKIGAILFTDTVEKFIPPKKGRKHILRIISEILTFSPQSKQTNLSVALQYFTNAIKKKSTAFVISDFFDDNYENALKIASKKHDIVALSIFDNRETELFPLGLAYIKNPENGQVELIDTSRKQLQLIYNEWYLSHKNYLRQLFNKYNIDHLFLSTHSDYIKPLMQLFKKRAK